MTVYALYHVGTDTYHKGGSVIFDPVPLEKAKFYKTISSLRSLLPDMQACFTDKRDTYRIGMDSLEIHEIEIPIGIIAKNPATAYLEEHEDAGFQFVRTPGNGPGKEFLDTVLEFYEDEEKKEIEALENTDIISGLDEFYYIRSQRFHQRYSVAIAYKEGSRWVAVLNPFLQYHKPQLKDILPRTHRTLKDVVGAATTFFADAQNREHVLEAIDSIHQKSMIAWYKEYPMTLPSIIVRGL